MQSYLKVVEMAPQHLEARLCLSTLQQQLGRPLRALQAPQPMYDPDTLAPHAAAPQQVGGQGGAVCVCVRICVCFCLIMCIASVCVCVFPLVCVCVYLLGVCVCVF